MNANGSFAKALSDAMALWEVEQYDRARKRVEEMRKAWPGNAHLHVLAARLIQLEEDPKQSLGDAKRLLQQAIELDKQSPAASIELGYFHDNVEDDPQSAHKAFAQGIAAARNLLVEGLLGQAGAFLQLENSVDAVRCIVEAMHIAELAKPSLKKRFVSRIEDLLREMAQVHSA